MHRLFDTRTVHPLDRYEYYRAGAAAELAPVSVYGRSPGQLLAVMSVAKIGDFEIDVHTWAADREVTAERTKRLIRVSDPECYRIVVGATAGPRIRNSDQEVRLRARDIALYDVSQPWRATNPIGPIPMRVVMLTFPRALVPVDYDRVRLLHNTLTPRCMSGRSLVAQFLVGLAEPAATECSGLAEVLCECVVGLIRQRLGEPTGTTPHTRRLLHRARINGIIRHHIDDPALDPEGIARAANISPRYLYSIFQDAELTPMQLVKRLRLQEAHHRLLDPGLVGTSIRDIMSGVGYVRADQFARDFRQMFGVSARDARQLAGEQPSSCG